MKPEQHRPPIVLLYHKPKGLVSSRRDDLGRETVYDRLIPKLPPDLQKLEWHSVGRLDKDTTGLLLFTDDGAFVHHATQPATGLKKRYLVLAKGLIDENQILALSAGVELSGGLGRSAPARAVLLSHNVGTSWISVEVCEGKNREVRRMMLAVGSQAIRLHRQAIEGLELDVEEDCWRRLDDGEISEKLRYA